MSPMVKTWPSQKSSRGLSVPRGQRLEPDLERVDPASVKEGIQHFTPAVAAELQPGRTLRSRVEAGVGNDLSEFVTLEVVRGFPVRPAGLRLNSVLQFEAGRPLVEPDVNPHPVQGLDQARPGLPLADQVPGR